MWQNIFDNEQSELVLQLITTDDIYSQQYLNFPVKTELQKTVLHHELDLNTFSMRLMVLLIDEIFWYCTMTYVISFI